MINLGLKQIELQKLSGHWRAKGFKSAEGRTEPLRINRYDCYVTFQRKNWVMSDLNGNTIKSNPILLSLLKSIT